MIKFPLDSQARVELTDRLTAVLFSVVIDQAQQKVVFFVVQDKSGERWLVPLNDVVDADDALVRLRITSENLFKRARFDESQYTLGEDVENDFFKASSTKGAPLYFITDTGGPIEVALEEDLALIRGAYVDASNGHVGTIEEIIIEPETGRASQIVIHTDGRNRQELNLPISVIDRVEGDTVILKLTMKEIKSLPSVPVEYSKSGKLRYSLVIRIFDKVDGAEQAYQSWKDVWSKQSNRFTHSVAIVMRDKSGNATFKDLNDVDKRQGRLFGAVSGGLIGLVGGPVGVVVGALAGAGAGGIAADRIDRGFSNVFLQEFTDNLQPGKSGLIVLVDNDGVPALAESMKGLSGVALQEDISQEMIDEYLKEGTNG